MRLRLFIAVLFALCVIAAVTVGVRSRSPKAAAAPSVARAPATSVNAVAPGPAVRISPAAIVRADPQLAAIGPLSASPSPSAPSTASSAASHLIPSARPDGGAPAAPQCRIDSDCAAGHGCLVDPGSGRRGCLPSECEADGHCFPGFACRVQNDGTAGPLVRRCVPEGMKRRGEACSVFEPTPETACGEGLVCHFYVCGVRCAPGADAGCAPDESCVPSQQGEGAVCLPSCVKTGCAEGKTCVTLGALSTCARVLGEDCTRTACPAGTTCDVDAENDRVAFACRTPCSSVTGRGCGQGEVCGAGVGGASLCYRGCFPKGTTSCEAGRACRVVNEEGTLFGCR